MPILHNLHHNIHDVQSCFAAPSNRPMVFNWAHARPSIAINGNNKNWVEATDFSFKRFQCDTPMQKHDGTDDDHPSLIFLKPVKNIHAKLVDVTDAKPFIIWEGTFLVNHKTGVKELKNNTLADPNFAHTKFHNICAVPGIRKVYNFIIQADPGEGSFKIDEKEVFDLRVVPGEGGETKHLTPKVAENDMWDELGIKTDIRAFPHKTHMGTSRPESEGRSDVTAASINPAALFILAVSGLVPQPNKKKNTQYANFF